MPVPKPASEVESEIFELYKEFDPASAYVNGLKEYVGKLLIPSKRNLEKFSRRVDELRLKAENKGQEKLLASLAAAYGLAEPQGIPESVLNAYFGYLIREGIIPSHMRPLTRNAIRAMEVAAGEYAGKDWPTGLRVLTLIRCEGLQEIIRTVKKETADKELKKSMDELSTVTKKYASIFRVNGFRNQGFDGLYRLIKKDGWPLGREKVYAQAVRRLYDYPESPGEVEAKGLRYLDRELPRFKRITEKLAKKYGVRAQAEEVSKALRAKRSLRPNEIIPFLNELRTRVLKVVNKRLVRVNPKYDAKVLETPLYLSAIFPSGGAYFYDMFTNNPKEIFIATTDPRRDPSTTPGELLNLLIHEEYGHCVHASNSAAAYGAKPTLTDMVPSYLGNAISEGMSFQRELEFHKVMEKLQEGKGLDKDEKSLVSFFGKYGGLDAVAEEYEFYTWMWRIIRFLRIVGDVRLNTGKQNLSEFIEWGYKHTGLPRNSVYSQLFPAHEGIGPGYASTYAIVGESVRELQNKALRNGKKLVDLNTYAISMGFPARTIFEERLAAFAAK
ncbi:MAG: hypothetical protein AUJ07_00045 [Crenarchaeota archaeon 13_1_40CM_3_53_5]|nr:MAG: hypothetical protein AUJ07_00045 [Crenarchaeota archaeon 13_1_40CM_3_53_5]